MVKWGSSQATVFAKTPPKRQPRNSDELKRPPRNPEPTDTAEASSLAYFAGGRNGRAGNRFESTYLKLKSGVEFSRATQQPIDDSRLLAGHIRCFAEVGVQVIQS